MMAHVGVSPWEWHPHPDVWALVLVLGGAYWLALTRLGPRLVGPGEAVTTSRQAACFAAGLVVLWVHADWPVHDIGEHYLFSVHMVQHIGFSLIAVPLLLLGLPGWLVRLAARPRAARFVLARVARPLPAAVVFNTVVVLTHWPVVVEATLRNHPVHLAVHVVIVTSAALMWFPVVNRLPELPTMSYPGRMLYLFLQSVIPTVPASFMTFGQGLLYPFYGEVPRPFALSAIDDQQLAGALMKVYAGTLLWAVIVVLFYRWYAGEQRDKVADVLTWDDVKRELERTGPGRPSPPPPPSS